ncbi:hypothetical protein HELRODRAFT_171448 [Helobdella robusta]|uniref:Uncharacterized protein n=1 Tax=Helobdella robusta TaxID=6412 RepID=T1F4A5_HELRO|nr:hypothetical protein HELRODRAFT_171448 [Helobdella robusta]ESO05776.1 hypothetical protein HELRODRAFT_171448 [Helobdella robusta]
MTDTIRLPSGFLKAADVNPSTLEHFCDFHAAATNNWSLEKIDFSWNSFTENQALFLIHGIKDNQFLTWVDLSHNNIGEKGCTAVGKCLSTNHVLQYLDISSNFITAKGAELISNGLKKNDVLFTFKVNFACKYL